MLGTLLDSVCLHIYISIYLFVCLYTVISLCLHSIYNRFADDKIVV